MVPDKKLMAKEARVQSQPPLHSEFKADTDYGKPSQEKGSLFRLIPGQKNQSLIINCPFFLVHKMQITII